MKNWRYYEVLSRNVHRGEAEEGRIDYVGVHVDCPRERAYEIFRAYLIAHWEELEAAEEAEDRVAVTERTTFWGFDKPLEFKSGEGPSPESVSGLFHITVGGVTMGLPAVPA